MTSTLQVTLTWKDEFISWNERIYPMTIEFKSSEIWVPDILAMNNVNNFKFEQKESYLVGHANNIFDFNERNKYFIMVNSSGMCRWTFPMKLMSICELDQQYFPFDIQKCFLEIKSSAYKSEQLLLQKHEDGIHLKLINEGEFDLVKAQADEVSNGEKDETLVRITLIMKRKIVFYMNKIILPYFVFYIVTIFTYILPVDAGEKKSYSTSILISVMIYLKDISNFIPKTHLLPMLSIYFNVNLIFVFICIISTTLVYLIYYCDKTKRHLPRILKTLVEKTKYALQDNLLNETLLSNGRHITQDFKHKIKKELKMINMQLSQMNDIFKIGYSNLEAYEKEDKLHYLHVLRKRKDFSSTDAIGVSMLNFFIDYKNFILKHDLNMKKCKNELIDLNSEISDNKSRISNINYINTLENIKATLIRRKKSHDRINSQRFCCYDEREEAQHYLRGRKMLKKLQDYKTMLKTRLKSYEDIRINNILDMHSIGKLTIKNLNLNTTLLPYNYEWKYLALIFDRVLFLSFSILIPVSILIMYFKALIFSEYS
jgi:hypothetical protein